MSLGKAHQELFRRSPDECFPSLGSLHEHCRAEKEASQSSWHEPHALKPFPEGGRLQLAVDDIVWPMNDWSFQQLCRLADVQKDTVNRLTPETASRVLNETLPRAGKPLQLYGSDAGIRSMHGVAYTRLFNADVLSTVIEWAEGFVPPQPGVTGGTGLYCGEQDMFCFLIDPTGWIEIGEQAFAPGFFVWNSEVGRRTVGIQSFWFQAVCQNHIVWDATDISEFSRKHTSGVGEALENIRGILHRLVERRDNRRDAFLNIMAKAMKAKLGDDADEVLKKLAGHGFSRALAREALELAKENGAFTVYSVVDALTRMAQRERFAGNRVEADTRAAQLLSLVA